jgi:catechol 2,3-dioxygenase-like lactoylglutathione lyase family enzyme
MLGSEKLMAFIATADAARAKTFYVEVLGLRLVSDEEWAVVFDAHGTMLRMQKAPAVKPLPYTALGWQVPDIALAVATLRDRGVSFERYDHLPQDASGVWTTRDGSKVAWFKDPDGNLLSLTQF